MVTQEDKKYERLSREQTVNSNEEISLKQLILTFKDFIHYILKNWIIVFVISLIGGLLGFTYANFKKVYYVASSTFVLEDAGMSGSSSLGQYAGLASMVGVDLGGAGGGIFQGDNLLELYKSRSMVEKTLLSAVVIDGKKQLLINKYISINELEEKWKKNPLLRNLKIDFSDKKKFNRLQDSIVSSIVSDINSSYLTVAKLDKKLSIIKVDVKANNEVFAKLFNDQIVKNVNDFYIQTKTKKSLDNFSILQHQTDSIRAALNGAIFNVASALDANPNANYSRQILRVPSQKRQIDAEANKAILSELVKNLELAKVSLRKEAPLIQIIDQPILPLEVIKLGRIKSFIIGAFVFGFFAVIFFVGKKVYQKIMV